VLERKKQEAIMSGIDFSTNTRFYDTLNTVDTNKNKKIDDNEKHAAAAAISSLPEITQKYDGDPAKADAYLRSALGAGTVVALPGGATEPENAEKTVGQRVAEVVIPNRAAGAMEFSVQTPNKNGAFARMAASGRFSTVGNLGGFAGIEADVSITPEDVENLVPEMTGAIGVFTEQRGILVGFVHNQTEALSPNMPDTIQAYEDGSISKYMKDNPGVTPVMIAWTTVNDNVYLKIFGGAQNERDQDVSALEDMFKRGAFLVGGGADVDINELFNLGLGYTYGMGKQVGNSNNDQTSSQLNLRLIATPTMPVNHSLAIGIGPSIKATNGSYVQKIVDGEMSLDEWLNSGGDAGSLPDLIDTGKVDPDGNKIWNVPAKVVGAGPGFDQYTAKVQLKGDYSWNFKLGKLPCTLNANVSISPYVWVNHVVNYDERTESNETTIGFNGSGTVGVGIDITKNAKLGLEAGGSVDTNNKGRSNVNGFFRILISISGVFEGLFGKKN
jgi:hypothetical protein